MEPLTVEQLNARVVAEHRLNRIVTCDGAVVEDARWRGWRLDARTYVLSLVVDDRVLYEVDLERCASSAEVLDWLVQVTNKTWVRGAHGALVVGGLVRALRDVLDPQTHLCSFGHDRRIGPDSVRYLVDSFVADPYREAR